jgi:hypothetical protein
MIFFAAMRPLRWTAIASLATFLCGVAFCFVMRDMVGAYYVRAGTDIPLFVRQLIILARIFRRFAWVLVPFMTVCWFMVFVIVHLIRGNKSSATSAS